MHRRLMVMLICCWKSGIRCCITSQACILGVPIVISSFNKSCDHDLLDEEEASLGERKWERAYLQRSSSTSSVFDQLAKIVKDKRLYKSLSHCTRNVATDQLESCHSMMLKYVPKRLHFKFLAMVARTCLAAMDHNFNVERQLTAAQKMQWSRITSRWVLKNVFARKDSSWRNAVLEKAINFRRGARNLVDQYIPFAEASSIPQNIAPWPHPSPETLRHEKTLCSRHIHAHNHQ